MNEGSKMERKLAVGDVLRASWGYDQTNVDYYEVIELVGKASVKVREIAQDKKEEGFMCGRTVPKPGEYCGAAKVFRVCSDGASIKTYDWGAWARKVEKVNGEYPSSYWSSYA